MMFTYNPKEHALPIAQATKKNIDNITEAARTHNYSEIDMLRPDGVVGWSPSLPRRWNDVMAATYAHSLALAQKQGDDCMDWRGATMEVKFRQVDSRQFWIGPKGGLNYGSKTSPTSLLNVMNANFRVYKGTKAGHHNKDTAFVLYSDDHLAFITGFVMPGADVDRLLNSGQTATERTISLARFIELGYEFPSMVPHIGWARYEECLRRFVMAREGMLGREEALQALYDWFSLANVDNLKTL